MEMSVSKADDFLEGLLNKRWKVGQGHTVEFLATARWLHPEQTQGLIGPYFHRKNEQSIINTFHWVHPDKNGHECDTIIPIDISYAFGLRAARDYPTLGKRYYQGPYWYPLSLYPMDLYPSLRCTACHTHGYIIAGKWHALGDAYRAESHIGVRLERERDSDATRHNAFEKIMSRLRG